jgi:exodeoxyribonuclease VIII
MTPTEFQPGKEGVFFDLADRTYRQAPGISNSMRKHVSMTGTDPGSPAHFQVYLKDPTRMTKPLLMGRLAHGAILRPDDPLDSIAIQPAERPAVAGDSAVKQKKVGIGEMIPWHNGSKACKEWNAAQEAAGNVVLSEKEYESLVGIVKSVSAHPAAARALKDGQGEVSVFKQFWRNFQDPDGKERQRMILRKARMDWVTPGNAIVDIKTTTDARPDSFSRAIYDLQYYVQAAYYLDIWNDAHDEAEHKTCFVFVAVEKKPPYAVNVFEVHPNALAAGREQYTRDLNILMTCEETDSWPAYGDDIKGLDLPQYVYRKEAGAFL